MDHPSLLPLAHARRSCRVCMQSTPGEIKNGSEEVFDPVVVSHWSQWLGDPKPELVVVGQDFGTFQYFLKFRGKDDVQNKTNFHLHRLLITAGFRPALPNRQDCTSKVFLTNSILCFKTAIEMKAPLQQRWARACVAKHLSPLLDALAPKAMVAMGGPAWQALRHFYKLDDSPEQITKAAGTHWSVDGLELFPMAHCSNLGQVNRAFDLQVQDWERLGLFLGYES